MMQADFVCAYIKKKEDDIMLEGLNYTPLINVVNNNNEFAIRIYLKRNEVHILEALIYVTINDDLIDNAASLSPGI